MQPDNHNEVAEVRETIMGAASENSHLLHELAKTEDAPGLLDAQQVVLEATRKELTEQTSAVKRLKNATDEQYAAHKKLRDSRFRKIYYRVTRMLDKFDAKAMKEEREYFNSLAAQSKAEGREQNLQQDVEAAEKALEPLEKLAQLHMEIHQKIDTLYESLFAGRTPGFPFEDEREQAFYVARENNEITKRDIIGARQAGRLLAQATNYLKQADTYAVYALQDATASFFFFDEAHGLLRYCEVNIGHAQKAFEKASVALGTPSPDVQILEKMLQEAAQAADLRSGPPLDKTEIVPRIDVVRAKLSELHKQLELVTAQIKERETQKRTEIRTTARVLEEARRGLEETRQGIFEDVAGFGEAAPPYNYCCDRTDAHCELGPPPADDDIFNLPSGPPPAEVAAQASEQSRQQGSEPNNAQDPPPPMPLTIAQDPPSPMPAIHVQYPLPPGPPPDTQHSPQPMPPQYAPPPMQPTIPQDPPPPMPTTTAPDLPSAKHSDAHAFNSAAVHDALDGEVLVPRKTG